MAEPRWLRRRSPLWIRSKTTRELHGIIGHLALERRRVDLSERQEWLWDALVSELEWRNASKHWAEARCSCEYCTNAPPECEGEEPF